MEIFTLPQNEVINRILNEINRARLNPIKYSEKVERYSEFICKDVLTEKQHLYLDNGDNQKFKVFLKRGKNSFYDCIDFLRNLPEKMKDENFKLKKLELIKELKFPFPENNLELIDNDDYIEFNINKIKKNIKGKYQMIAFNYYACFVDIEPLSILHILDDCNEDKVIQKAIFSPYVNYIGINFCKINEGLYIVYYLYAK